VGRLIALLLGGFGLGAYLRARRRKQAWTPEYSPADELRTKLAESRAQPEAQPEPEGEPEPTLESDLDARRQQVHDRARGAIDDLS
jgi:hypothetical protein